MLASKKFGILFLSIFILLAPLSVFASSKSAKSVVTTNQIPPPASLFPPQSPVTGSQALESCFTYYTFGSLGLSFTTDTDTLSQGATLNLRGTVTNLNPYPVDDVTVYAKIFYQKSTAKSPYGPDVVDSFKVADNLTLKAGQALPLTSTWIVPSNAEPGTYEIAGYVVSHDRFNMAGLTFTNDVVATLRDFAVAGLDRGAVRFDVSNASVSGSPTYSAAFPPSISVSPNNSYPVKVGVYNTTSMVFQGEIHWSVYYWDASDASHLLSQSTQAFTINAHASTTASYTVKDSNHTVYYVVAKLIPNNPDYAKSIIGMRYVLIQPSYEPRLAYVGTDAYPGTSGSKIFACVNSTGLNIATDTRLVLSAHPLGILASIPFFNNLGSKVYTGDIPGAVSAISMPLTRASDNFSVTASLYQHNKLIDTVTSDYSCKTLGEKCSSSAVWVVLILIVVVVLIALFFLYKWNKKRKDGSVSSSNQGMQ